MQEKDIKEGINSPLFFPYSDRPKEFIVYKVNNFWNVKFTSGKKVTVNCVLNVGIKVTKLLPKILYQLKP